MAEGNLNVGAVYESVNSDAEEIRKVADNIVDEMEKYVEDMKGIMGTKVQAGFAADFERDLNVILSEKTEEIKSILFANAQNMNVATESLQAYENTTYDKVN